MSAKMILRTACILVITLVFLLSGVSPAQAQAPINDDFANASVIDSLPFNTTAELTEATSEITDPSPSCGGGLGKTVWYRYTPGTDTLIVIDLGDGWPDAFDVSVYRQVSGGLELLKCDQYYDPPSYLWLTAGEVYYFMLNTSTSDPAYVSFGIGQVPPPPNDHYSQAEAVSTPFQRDVDIRAATLDPGEPIPTCVSASMGRTIWFSFTPEVAGSVLAGNPGWGNSFWAMYTGETLESLDELYCDASGYSAMLEVSKDQRYYFQVGSNYGDTDLVSFMLNFFPKPPNDNFADASVISLGDTISSDNTMASLEVGEPHPPCGDAIKTVWFVFTPTTSGSVTADPSEWWNFVAVYTGSELGNLDYIACREYGEPLPFLAESGSTYYFQVGTTYEWWGYGAFSFQLYETPPPTADFWYGPGDPNVFETMDFCDTSTDPVNLGFTEFLWDFGDGVTATVNCAPHRYTADGDYTVWHNVQTSDGRTDPDGVTRIVSVRTHDVTAVRVAAPKSASAGQTRPITVYIKNIRYPERVQVELYKSVPGGFEWVATTNQNIPVRLGNRTTAVNFSYTFVQDDADIGKVTFKAVVNLIDARDALPGDNEAISPPTKVQ